MKKKNFLVNTKHQKTAIATLCLQFCKSLILLKNYAHGQKKVYPVHGLYRYPPTMLLLGKVQQRNWCRLLVILWIVWQNLLHLISTILCSEYHLLVVSYWWEKKSLGDRNLSKQKETAGECKQNTRFVFSGEKSQSSLTLLPGLSRCCITKQD